MEKQNLLTVVKSNKVIEASYLLSLAEQRVLLACIAQVDSKSDLSKEYKFEVSVAEIVDLAGLLNVSNLYRDLKKASDKLYERSIVIDDPCPDNPKIKRRKIRWVSGIDYMPGEGKIILSFSADIIPYISKLSKEFTKYKLNHIAKFESIYSIRLYEMLVQWSSTGIREIELEWLKKQFVVSDKYRRLGDLKRRVIDPAVAEINEHSNIWVKYGQRKSGRIVTHLQFEFGVKGDIKPLNKVTDNDISLAARPGETRPAVAARLSGTSMSNFAKPGESWEDAIQRKKELQKIKIKLK